MGLRTYPRAYFELLIVAFTLIMGMSLPSAFLPLFARELNPSELLVGFVSSAWFVSRIFTELPSGILADRLGRRRLLLSGLALSAAGAFLCSTAEIIQVLIIGRALWGLGTGLFFMSSSAAIFDLFESSVRGRALGTFQAIEFAGSFIGAPIGSFMVASTGFRGVFQAASALMVCSLVVAFSSRGLRQEEAEPEQSGRSLTDVLSSLRSWGLTTIYISSFSRMLIWAGLTGTVLPLYMSLDLGIPVELIGLVVSLRTLGMITATAVSGYLSDMFGRKPMILLGLLLESTCCFAYTTTSLYEMLLLIALAEGLGRGMVLTSIMVLLSEMVSSKTRGGALGMYRTFMDVGGFTGPLFFMVVFEEFGSYYTFLAAIIIIAASMALIATVKTKKASRE